MLVRGGIVVRGVGRTGGGGNFVRGDGRTEEGIVVHGGGKIFPVFLGDGRKSRGRRPGGHWNGQNVDPECADGEENDNGFGEHDDAECRKREQITTAPGLRLERLEKGAGESCTAAEETRECISNLLYT